MKINNLLLLFFILLAVNVLPAVSHPKGGHPQSGNPDSTKTFFEKGLDQIKMQKARNLFLGKDYKGAIETYELLYHTGAEDMWLNYRMGECYFAMSEFETAAKHFDKVYTKNPGLDKELLINYGRTLHRIEQLDKAIELYEKHKSTIDTTGKGLWSKQSEMVEVNRLIEQVRFAKEMMTKPANVSIVNMGQQINSRYDDHGPSISADGKTLIFTARRPENTGGARDPEDKKYFEDIYISNWVEADRKWSYAHQIPGRLNTELHDGCLSLAPDGEEMFVYRNSGEGGSGEIFISRLSASGKWGTAKELGKTINTSYFESSASITADGKKLFFISERKGGNGMADIYMSERISKTEWGAAVGLGPVINSPGDERMVFVHPNGNTLFFSSDGRLGMGGYDLYKSSFENGQWTAPVPLPYPINTVNDEVNFSLTSDNKKAYISALKPGGLGELDIYEIDLSGDKIIE